MLPALPPPKNNPAILRKMTPTIWGKPQLDFFLRVEVNSLICGTFVSGQRLNEEI